jgi:hypothetical protein
MSEEDEMPVDLHYRLGEIGDSGGSFTDLVAELDRHRDGMSPRDYDELWLFCWVLAKRRVSRLAWDQDAELWPEVGAGPR